MNLDFNKGNGLIPAIIQDARNMQVLMLGYMNQAAYAKTLQDKKVCFYSRSKERLWTKGESSSNFLNVKNLVHDCDRDTLLIQVIPEGPTCHLGTSSCFGTKMNKGFLYELEETIHNRIDKDEENSYTNRLYKKGMNKVAQKLGEEAVELVIEAKDENKELFLGEAADLMYHFLILLKAKNLRLEDVETVLNTRS